MRRLNMDYLLSGPGDEVNLSLQDMIECDMKTEFDEPLTNGTNISLTGDDLDSSLADSLAPGTDLHHHHHLDKDVDCKPDRTWLQSVSLSTSVLQSDSASEVFQMVNPQTGLPVQTDSGSSSPTSDVLSVSSASTGRPAIQYVTTTAAVAATAAQQQQHQAQQRASGTSTAACTGASTISAPAVTNSTTVLRQRNITVTTAATNTVSTAAAHQLHCLHNSKLITQALSSGTTVTLSSVAYQQLLQQQQQQSSRNGASLVTQQLLSSNNNHLKPASRLDTDAGKVYPKPVYSYSCLIAMALKNSETGALPVSEIYTFMTENFPYFKTAPDGWKNSVRHNLSLNKCFEKIENPKATGSTRKGCLWGLNPAKIGKMDEEIAKWRKKDLEAIQRSMAKPEVLEKLEKGNLSSHNQRRHLANNTTNSSDQEPTREDLVPLKNKLVSYAAAAPNTKPIIGDIQLSMIEIKPAQNGVGHLPVKVKVEPIFTIKPESVDPSGAVGCALTAEDLSVLDSSLSLDPSLNDAALQNSVWEELGAEGISLDDIPFMSFGPSTSSSSPVTVQTAKSGSSSSCAKSPVVSLLSSSNTANGASGSHTVVTSAGLSVSHRIFAQT